MKYCASCKSHEECRAAGCCSIPRMKKFIAHAIGPALMIVGVVLMLTACTTRPPVKLERTDTPAATPLSHTAMCADPARWNKWVCTNLKPEVE
jgi:hypothetical protein